MSAKVLEFVSRAQRLFRLRGMRNFGHYKRRSLGLEPLSPAERLKEQADDEANEKNWAKRHGPLPGGAIVLSFETELIAAVELSQTTNRGPNSDR
jgi:hypothetical protein